ncbi:MAG TPA: AarF/UbiB family protein [Bryobacteraceae bacterium]|nr:AarF/UbiB family protein [Bryobacteraceae bacterium]
MTGIEDIEFLLPRDVVICPVDKLAADVRRQIACDGSEFAVSRPHLRIPSKLIDSETASLLQHFQTPSSIVDAITRYSRESAADPVTTLEDSFDALRSLIAGQILVPDSDPVVDTPKATFVPGMQIAGCRIVRVIQALEDCAVYEAVSLDRRTVAIKVVPSAAHELAHTMLRHEAQALRLLNGHCAPALLAEGDCDGDRYLILEWIPGRDIASEAARLRLGGDAQLPALHQLCLGVLRCFADLHKACVIHGDIHPGNIIVSSQGEVRLLDFGRCASPRLPFELIPRAGVGHYYEPELANQIASNQIPQQPTEAGEQYAIAALVYQLFTGRAYTIFSLEKQTLLRQVMDAEPMSFARAGVKPWPAIELALFRALAKDPARRFPTVDIFARRFEAAGAEAPPTDSTNRIADICLDRIDQAHPWIAFRAAVLRNAPHLLTAADIAAETAASCAGACSMLHYVRARIADARCDSYGRALADFLGSLHDPPEPAEISAACWFIARGASAPQLTRVLETYLNSSRPDDPGSEASVAWLRAFRALGRAPSEELRERLHVLTEQEKHSDTLAGPRNALDRICFWALADDLCYEDAYRRSGEHVALACLDIVPEDAGSVTDRAFAILHWYRHTGDPKWLSRAHMLARRCKNGSLLLALELERPELAELPPYDLSR